MLRVLLIAAYTLVLGSGAMVASLIRPKGGGFRPFARAWSWLVCRTCGVRTIARWHPRYDPSRAIVYISNHQSLMDIPALILAMPVDVRIIAKRELLFIPVFGWALWLAGFVFVDRSDRTRAIQSMEKAVGRLAAGQSIVVFAEGTRSPDGRLLPLKKGGFILAQQASVPIVPVAIRGGHAVLPKGGFRLRPGRMEVIFDAPIETRSGTPEERDALIVTVRDRIQALLESGVTPAPGAIRNT
jgi:1-acyl-sn-glycerol-3-phosphate acyltransferase